MFEEGLVPLLDVFANHIAIGKDLQPELRESLIGEVVMLGFLLLLCQQFSDLLEVGIGEGVLSGDDVVDFSGEGGEFFPEGSLDGFNLTFKLFIQFALLDEIAVEGDGLYLFGEGGERLDLFFYFLLDVDLNVGSGTSSSSSSQQSSEHSSAHSSSSSLAFLSLPPINNPN